MTSYPECNVGDVLCYNMPSGARCGGVVTGFSVPDATHGNITPLILIVAANNAGGRSRWKAGRSWYLMSSETAHVIARASAPTIRLAQLVNSSSQLPFFRGRRYSNEPERLDELAPIVHRWLMSREADGLRAMISMSSAFAAS